MENVHIRSQAHHGEYDNDGQNIFQFHVISLSR